MKPPALSWRATPDVCEFLLHVEQDEVEPGIGQMGGNAGTHDAGTDDGCFFDRGHGHAASRTMAMP